MITGFPLSVRLSLMLLLLGLGGYGHAATYKCWTNDEGVRECGQSVPPEYSQKRIEILNDRGMVIEVEEPPKTPEQIEEEKRAEELRKKQEKLEAEKRRRDLVLLRTFTTESDLESFYQDKINAIQSRVDIRNASNQSLTSHLNDLQKQAANLERQGKTPPENLLKEMESIKRQMNNNQNYIAELKQEITQLQQRRDEELKRFRELTSSNQN
ncbi:MAG: hypothetical protein PVG50_02890 [Thiohalophilus sp.]